MRSTRSWWRWLWPGPSPRRCYRRGYSSASGERHGSPALWEGHAASSDHVDNHIKRNQDGAKRVDGWLFERLLFVFIDPDFSCINLSTCHYASHSPSRRTRDINGSCN
ncbi:hypothetical protein CH063_01771 [Colletotrichum higginsianum]|uniref:Uncharacterized protein n=1 Tax=Colletotrichum higginsianum (strain IMI 349063) TaxID=759273 RepID=H1VC55_COLHI|nr:hypothetical protein CH063_01771 [Colletotrichum higginsianum]